jgi:hypothetical protein
MHDLPHALTSGTSEDRVRMDPADLNMLNFPFAAGAGAVPLVMLLEEAPLAAAALEEEAPSPGAIFRASRFLKNRRAAGMRVGVWGGDKTGWLTKGLGE